MDDGAEVRGGAGVAAADLVRDDHVGADVALVEHVAGLLVLFGQVAIDRPLIDWSGNCGNLTAAVGPFALTEGWVGEGWVGKGAQGSATVRIWQQNISKRILSHVPVRDGTRLAMNVYRPAVDGEAQRGGGVDARRDVDGEGAVLQGAALAGAGSMVFSSHGAWAAAERYPAVDFSAVYE